MFWVLELLKKHTNLYVTVSDINSVPGFESLKSVHFLKGQSQKGYRDLSCQELKTKKFEHFQ